MRIAHDEEELAGCILSFAAMQQDNLEIEWYKGEEGEGYSIPNDGMFNPLQRCRILAKKVLAQGAQLHNKTKAVKVTGT